jgi:hypothetical protein
VPWQVLLLPEVEGDLEGLRSSVAPRAAEDALVDEFRDPFKAARVDKLLRAGVSTAGIDRLATSKYPPSIRLHLLQDLRATAWCFPQARHAVAVHVFHKSQDPDYRRAVRIHDARLENYFRSFQAFIERHRR